MTAVSVHQARRIALAAQGLARRRPETAAGRARVRSALDRLGVLQIDSVNVVARAHYLPLFARVGPYDRDVVDQDAYRHRRLFEYWGHVASFLPVELYPAFRHRMDLYAARFHMTLASPYVEKVWAEVAEKGAVTVRDLSDPGKKKGSWWGWSDGKRALEHLFFTGRLAVADRRNFERRYDLPERVLPPEVLSAPALPIEEAYRVLLLRSIGALGIGTVKDVADYYRLKPALARPVLAELVAEGLVEKVSVEGWTDPAFLDPAGARHRKVDAQAIVGPFDPIVWERERTERLFDFRYRIEIYVPAPQRVYGYYVMPFLMGDRFVARVDLKADRQRGVLMVPGAYSEPDVDTRAVEAGLREELALMAGWLGLDVIERGSRGDLLTGTPVKRLTG